MEKTGTGMGQGSWLLAAQCVALVFAVFQVDVFAGSLKVRLAYPTRSMSLLHVQVAMEKRLFIKHGLDVEAIQIRSAVSLPALLGNEIQYMTSIGTGIRAAAKGHAYQSHSHFSRRASVFCSFPRQDHTGVAWQKDRRYGKPRKFH